MASMLDMLRRAIRASGQTRYYIAKETGVAQSQLSRLASGQRGLRIDTVERLADHLGLEIVLRRKAARRGKRG